MGPRIDITSGKLYVLSHDNEWKEVAELSSVTNISEKIRRLMYANGAIVEIEGSFEEELDWEGIIRCFEWMEANGINKIALNGDED